MLPSEALINRLVTVVTQAFDYGGYSQEPWIAVSFPKLAGQGIQHAPTLAYLGIFAPSLPPDFGPAPNVAIQLGKSS
jgi:hypothetical protein